MALANGNAAEDIEEGEIADDGSDGLSIRFNEASLAPDLTVSRVFDNENKKRGEGEAKERQNDGLQNGNSSFGFCNSTSLKEVQSKGKDEGFKDLGFGRSQNQESSSSVGKGPIAVSVSSKGAESGSVSVSASPSSSSKNDSFSNTDNDEKFANSVSNECEREEGELEEGEIDESSAGSPPSCSLGSAASTSLESPALSLDIGERTDRRLPKKVDGSHSEKDSRLREKSQLRDSDDRIRDPRRGRRENVARSWERDREKRINEVAEIVKNVKVKDAQKSVVAVCNQIQKALTKLLDINPGVPSGNVMNVVKQIFSGIRAAFAVRNTASGAQQQQQEQDKHAFPRLLRFAINDCNRFFTAKQIKELEGMLDSIMSGFRVSKIENSEEKGEGTAFAVGFKKLEDQEKIFSNEVSRKVVPGISTTISNQPRVDTSAFKHNQYSLNMLPTETRNSASNNKVYHSWGAESLDISYWRNLLGKKELKNSNFLSQAPNTNRETSLVDFGQHNVKCRPSVGQVNSDTLEFLRNGTQDEKDMAMPWQTDAIKAVTYYQERFRGKALCNGNRLPSPTPSEGEEDEDSSYHGKEGSVSSISKESQQRMDEKGPKIESSDEIKSDHDFSKFKTNVELPQILEHQSEVLSEYDIADRKETIHQLKPANLLPGYFQRPHAKSRDPRLRGDNSKPSEMGSVHQPAHPDSNVISTDSVRKVECDFQEEQIFSGHLTNQIDGHPFCYDFADTSSGTGGWLEENTIITPSDDWDHLSVTDIDNKQETSISTSLQDDHYIQSTTIEDDTVAFRNPNKRQKTEPFDDLKFSVGPEPDRDLKFSNAEDKNEQKSMSGSGQNKDERREKEISEAIRRTDILPSVLKDIAVNPTILMNLVKKEQEKLLSQTAQRTEQCQQNHVSFPLTSKVETMPNTTTVVQSNLPENKDLQQASTSKSTAPSICTTAESGRPRLKPRDPRRNLLMNLGDENIQLPTPVTMPCKHSAVDAFQRISQNHSFPNIEKELKQKLASISEILKNPEVQNSQASLAQDSISQTNEETSLTELKQQSMEMSNVQRTDSDQLISVSNDSNTSVAAPARSSLDENASVNNSNYANLWGNVDHLLEGLSEEQRIAVQQERARRIDEQNKMFSNRKLCLVLDLDHTLLNSAKFSEIDPVHEEILRKKEEQDREKPQRQLFRFPHMGMWTKLRPGIWDFLDRASKLYELHVYTMGNKVYATEMARLLDPTGTLFAGRVISKGDEGDEVDGIPKSKDLDGVLGMESAVVIIDDSARVWPHHRHNLIVVERYMYFPCSRRQFGLPGLSLLEADVDERLEDGTLASSLAVIEKIHKNFFSSEMLHEVDVRDFLAEEQRKILSGCKIVFSRVFPVGVAQPHLHPLWKMAEQFGAVCTTQIDDQVTHVVALAFGTDKVNWALTTGRHVVHPGWLEASALLYRRANERDFAITMNHFP